MNIEEIKKDLILKGANDHFQNVLDACPIGTQHDKDFLKEIYIEGVKFGVSAMEAVGHI